MLQKWIEHRRKLGLVVLLAAWTTTGGCFGRFPMTKAIYQINKNIGNSFEPQSNYRGVAKSIVMWVFIIVPVYAFAMIGDVIVLNLVEFWSGDTVDVTGNYEKDGMQWSWNKGATQNEIDLTLRQDGQTVLERRFVRQSPTEMTVMDKGGVTLGTMLRGDDNSIQLFDTEGQAQGTLDLKGLKAQGL